MPETEWPQMMTLAYLGNDITIDVTSPGAKYVYLDADECAATPDEADAIADKLRECAAHVRRQQAVAAGVAGSEGLVV